MAKILTIGEILVEIVATQRGNGFREPVPLVGPFPSGAPAIFIDQAGRLGHPCAIISRVGDDDFGHVNLDRLRADGVDVSGIEVLPMAATGSAFVRYREDGGRAFVFNIRDSACGRIPLSPAAEAVIDGCGHLHVMGTALYAPSVVESVLTALDRIKARGGTVSFDPNIRVEILDSPGMREALDAILARTDLFLPSGDEIFLFTEARDERAAVAELLGRGVRAVVIKRGAAGASYFDAGQDLTLPAFEVEEIDPTGAGDCFGATFVSFWLSGADPRTALRYATAAGALAVTRLGPMEGASTRRMLDSFLAAQER